MEEKIAEAMLEIHKILFDNAQDIILYVNMKNDIVDSNQRALERYDYTKTEILTKKITDIRHPSTYPEFMEQMRQADTGGIVFESLHICKNGSTFPVEVSAKSTFAGIEPLRIHIIRDITKRKEQEEKIVWLANNDSLTGIPNRNSFITHLENEIERSLRTNTQFAVMLFDVDKFKHINDDYGHEAGDLILCHVAKKVKEVIRSTDFLARLGGDEFVGLLTNVYNRDDIASLAMKIQEAASEPIYYKDVQLSVKISIGISLFPEDATNKDELLFYADKAMYGVKNNGGGDYAFYNS